MHDLFYYCCTYYSASFAAINQHYMATTIAKVYRIDKKNEQGLAPVYIRITKNRKASYIATDLRLDSKHWDDKNKKVKPNYPNSTEANTYLDGLVYQIQAEALKDQTENKNTTVRSIKERALGDKTTSFQKVAQGLLDIYRTSNRISTHDTFKATVNKVLTFSKSETLTLQQIDVQFLALFEHHLRSIGNKPNTIHKDLKGIRRVFNTAYRQNLIEHNQNPFLKYQLKLVKTVREHLTEDELRQLEGLKLDPNSRLELHRDMFVFACYAGGLRVSDLLLLKWSNFDGTHIRFTIRKTNTQHTLKLPNPALAILGRYKPVDQEQDGFIFPMLPADLDLADYVEVDRRISSCTAYINKNLKILSRMAGIKKNLHFHVSRHTFACLALSKKVGIEYVQRFLAHSNIRETQVYAKLESKELDAAMEKFNS